MRRVWLLTCVFALAVPAATAAPPKPDAFHVTIHATMDAQYDFANQNGCTTNETRHVVVRNEKPLTLTAHQLGKAQNFLFTLVATEQRSVTYTATLPNGCTGHEGATNACGTVKYQIGSVGTGVGFTNRTSNKFWLFYTRIGTDPYQGACGPGVAAAPGSKVPVWTDNFPPGGLPGTWGPIPGSAKYGVIPGGSLQTTVDRANLGAHKRFAVQWSEAGESQNGSEHEQLAASWQVTLVPAS